jgi:hypothetical protein
VLFFFPYIALIVLIVRVLMGKGRYKYQRQNEPMHEVPRPS